MDASRPRGAGRNRFLAIVAAGVLLMLAPAPAQRAFADGDERPATDPEKQFHALVAGVFSRAIPPGPQGWVEQRGAVEPPERVPTGAEKLPFRVSYQAAWTDRRRLQEAEPKKMQATMEIVNAPDPEGQALMRRNGQLAEELGAAAGRRDQATVARIGKELEAIQKKLSARAAARDQRLKEAMLQTTPRDTGLAVWLEANEFSKSLPREAAAEPSIAGGLAYRTKGQVGDDGGWREGTTYVFLGRGWRHLKDGGARVETRPRPDAPSLAVQAIVVRVEADAARARAYLEKLDWAALKKLLAD